MANWMSALPDLGVHPGRLMDGKIVCLKDGCMDGWMAVWMNWRLDGWHDGRMPGRMVGRTDLWMDGRMRAWMDARMDDCMDGFMKGWKRTKNLFER